MCWAISVLFGFLLSHQVATLRPSHGGDYPAAPGPNDGAHDHNEHGHQPPTNSPVEVFNEQVRHEVRHLYLIFDVNHDGSFTREDLPLSIRVCDSDGNGTVESEEFEMKFDMQEPTLALIANDVFKEFDSDQNSRLDLSDMSALYDRMDLNKDGRVDNKEFEEYMTEVMTVLVALHLQGQEFS